MKIAIGSDHRGFELKKVIVSNFSDINWTDVGTDSEDRVDFPMYSKKVCDLLLSNFVDRGIVICGSGIGVSIAANRNKNIYAALCWSPEVAKSARNHDLANVLALPADFVDKETAIEIVKTWLSEGFNEGVYRDRLNMIEMLY